MNEMKDWDFRFGLVSGYLTALPETNCVGFFVDRRGCNFSINIGLLFAAALICVDFEPHSAYMMRMRQRRDAG